MQHSPPDAGSFTARHAPAPDASIPIEGFTLQRYQNARHFAILNDWLSRPYARFWGMTDLSEAERANFMADKPGKFGMLANAQDKPGFYMELYNPAEDEVGQHYQPAPGDCGMHLLLGPPDQPVHGFSRRAIACTLAFILDYLGFERVVVEPDANNEKIHPLNHAVGIHYAGKIQLSYKTACLGFATREDFHNALASR